MKSGRLLFISTVIFLISISAPAQISPDLEQGMRPYGSYHGGDLDHISMSNGNLFFHADLMAYAQRGGELAYPIALQYNGENFSLYTTPNCPQGVNPGTQGCPMYMVFGPPWVLNNVSAGNSVTIGYEGGSVTETIAIPVEVATGAAGVGINTSLSYDGNPIYVQTYSVLTPDGSLHPLANTDGGAMVLDGSGYSTPNGRSLTDGHGTRFNNIVEDANGNQINFNTNQDSMGRTIPAAPMPASASTASLSSCPALGYSFQPVSYAYTWNLPTVNGGTLPLILCYANVYVRTGSSNGPGYFDVHQNFPMLQSVVFPDNTYWAFQYDAADPNNTNSIAYADLLKVTLPTGGTISYTWGGCSCQTPLVNSVLTRSVDANDGNGPRTWHYSYGGRSSINGTPTFSTTVTDPLGNDTVHIMTGLGGFETPYETKTQYYQGPQSSGTLLKTVQTDYQYTTNVYDSGYISSGGAPAAINSVTNVFPIRVTTTLANGLVSKTETDYDNALTYHGPLDGITSNTYECPNTAGAGGGVVSYDSNPSPSTSSCFYGAQTTNPVTNYTGSYGNVIATREYDWGQGAPGPLLRQTFTNYLWQSNSNYLNYNFLDLVSSTTVQDGNGNQVAQTTYGYDEYSLNSAGVSTQFNSNPVNGSIRGNQTSVHHWLNGSSSSTSNCAVSVSNGFAVSYALYNNTGTVYKSTDACGASAGDPNHTVTHTYSSSYAGAYPTQTCNALNQCVSGAYDFNTGLLTSFTDANSQITTYSYDNRWRMTQVLLPVVDSSGVRPETDFYYPNATTVQRCKKQNSNSSSSACSTGWIIDYAYFDGLGRTKQTRLVDPEGDDFVDTTYDADGRVSTVSNPHRSTSSATDGITTTQYDALSRVIQVTKQDGSISAVQYDLAVGATDCTLATDEAGKQRRSCSDGLGRMVEVDEPQASSVGTSATASVSISGSIQSVVTGTVYQAATGTPIFEMSPGDFFFIDTNGHAHELYLSSTDGKWHAPDWTALSGAPVYISGIPLTGWYDSNFGKTIIGIGSGQHVIAIKSTTSSGWQVTDITNTTGMADAPGTPIYMAGGGDYYPIDANGHAHEMFWSNPNYGGDGTWHAPDWTAASGAPPFIAGAPTDLWWQSGNVWLLGVGSGQHIIGMHYLSGSPWSYTDISNAVGGVTDAASTPIYEFSPGDFYMTDSNGHGHELFWSNPSYGGDGTWHAPDWTAASGAPAFVAGIAPLLWGQTGNAWMIGIGSSQHIIGIHYQSNAPWQVVDITNATGVADAAGTPITQASPGDFYPVDSNGHVHEMWYGSDNVWHTPDWTSQSGAPAFIAGIPAAVNVQPGNGWVLGVNSSQHIIGIHYQSGAPWQVADTSILAASTYDSGTVSLTLGSFTATACFGSSTNSACTGQPVNSTPAQVASALANAINIATSPATATASGSTINLIWKTPGPFTPGVSALSTTHDNSNLFSSPSFTSPATNFGNGTGNLGSSPYVTLYSYDTLGNLTQVNQKGDGSQAARVRTFTYDSLSRLLTAYNPESGTISYSYDADSNLLQKTSPAPNQTGTATQTISYCYDKLNRIIGKQYSAVSCPLSSPVVQYFYDQTGYQGLTIANGIGRLTGIGDQAGTGAYSYDALGRMITEQRSITGVTKTLGYSYFLDNSLKSVSYPSGAVVNYGYTGAGRIGSVQDTLNNINYVTGTSGSSSLATHLPDGSPISYVNGVSGTFNGISNTLAYNSRLQPVTMSASAPNQTVFSIGYDFHQGIGDNGNVFSLINYRDQSRTQTFTYDALNRLTSAQNAGTDCTKMTVNGKTEYWGNSYGYDPWGNLITKTPTKCSAENLNEAAWTNNQLHTISGADNTYDAAGNMTHDATTGNNYSYDAENRITGAAGYTYIYDADGNRVEKSNGSTGTIYWSMSPGIVAESDLSGNLKSEYVFFNGRRTARRDFPGGAVSYYFSDELGTASVITNAAGTITEDEDFYPWGGELQFINSDSNHYKYGGHERDSETSLDYMLARYYSNPLGRFLTPDWAAKPVTVPYADYGNPQSLNLYTYGKNNPTTFGDPDGHCDWCQKVWDSIKSGAKSLAIGFDKGVRSAATSIAGPAYGEAIGTRDIAGHDTGLTQPSNTLEQIGAEGTKAALIVTLAGPAAGSAPELAEGEALGTQPVITDEAIVVRGGVGEIPSGTFSGSVGSTEEAAGMGIKNNQMQVSTAGQIRGAGGTVEYAPEPAYPGGPTNIRHVNVTGGQKTFSAPKPNPAPKNLRPPSPPKPPAPPPKTNNQKP